MTLVIDSMRALALGGPLTPSLWETLAWLVGIFLVFAPLACAPTAAPFDRVGSASAPRATRDLVQPLSR